MKQEIDAKAVIKVSRVTFYNGKEIIHPGKDGAVNGARSACLNGRVNVDGRDGWASVFIDARIYNDRIGGRNVASVVQVLVQLDTVEDRTAKGNGKTYQSFHVVDDGMKIIKVSDGDPVAMAFTDETYPRIVLPQKEMYEV